MKLVSLTTTLAVLGALAFGCSSSDDSPNPEPVKKVRAATTCHAPSPSTAFHVDNAFPGVTVDRPTSIMQSGGVYYLTEQRGKIKRIANEGGRFTSTVALDIGPRLLSTGEMGLLGIALSPDFASSGEIFITYTRQAQAHLAIPGIIAETVLSRFVSRDGGRTIDPASEEVMLELERDVPNHNGGRLAFGPDRDLYVSIGDGSWGDGMHRVQNPNELFGKVLRLDVLGGHPYKIPADNPYANGGGRPEVFALGFRNPWTFSFDQKGRLWLADVGNDKWEEIDIVTKGGNYGWPIREGRHCLGASPCDVAGAIDPVFEYPHVDGFAVTGGFVYRGKQLALKDSYVFSDFVTGRVWAIDSNHPDPTTPRLLFDSGLFISNFGEDADGELLLLDFAGRVMRIDASRAPADVGPVSLRALDCLDGVGAATKVVKGFLPYDVTAPLWSDGLEKQRWLSVPPDSPIHVRDDGSWELPAGTILLKEFATGGKRIETRMLVRDAESGWIGYTFGWDATQTDAVLLEESKVVPGVGGAPWTIPSRAQCLTCHSSSADFVLGFKPEQINRDITTPKGATVNQIERLGRFNAFDRAVDATLSPSLRDPYGSLGTLEERARAYLSANCSTCHRPAVGISAGLDMRSTTPLDKTNLICMPPTIDADDLGVTSALIVAPGAPELSILYKRMSSTGDDRMPRIGSHRVDDAALALIRTWIMALPACPSK